MAICKGCGAEIDFIRTPTGKLMPVDKDMVPYWQKDGAPGKIVKRNGLLVSAVFTEEEAPPEAHMSYGRVPHWATCPKADKFKRAVNKMCRAKEESHGE